jgi:hypothetical protein
MGFTKVILSIFSRQVVEQPACFKKISETKIDKTKNIYFRFENKTRNTIGRNKDNHTPENKHIGF